MDVCAKAWNDANFGYYGGFQDGYFCGYQDGYAKGFKAAITKLQASLNDLDVPEPQIPNPPDFGPPENPHKKSRCAGPDPQPTPKVNDSKGT